MSRYFQIMEFSVISQTRGWSAFATLLLLLGGCAAEIASSPVLEGDGESTASESLAAGACPFEDEADAQVIFGGPGLEDPAAIERYTLNLINSVPAGGRMIFATYTWSNRAITDALNDAADRGVIIQAIIDDENASDSVVTDLSLRIDRIVCDSCIGTGINHNKFIIADRLCDGSRNVVLQSSSNLSGMSSVQNNSVVFRNVPNLYQDYVAYSADMVRHQLAGTTDLNYYRRTVHSSESVITYRFPRNDGGDTMASVINNVSCAGGGRIQVAMAFFNRRTVGDKLVQKAREGCRVEVIVSDTDSTLSYVRSALEGTGVQVSILPRLHSKYTLIDAHYAGSSAKRRLVFTGSHNFTVGALRTHDETLLRIDNRGIFEDFYGNWNELRSMAYEGHTGGWSRCQIGDPCGTELGDCDSSAECTAGHFCRDNYGAVLGRDPREEVCLPHGLADFCSSSRKCGAGHGDCDSDSECEAGLVCRDSDAECEAGLVCRNNIGLAYGMTSGTDVCIRPPDWELCTPGSRCGVGEGDCDEDADCEAGLECVEEQGHLYGGHPSVAVCVRPLDWDQCTPGSTCSLGEGDCDNDVDCTGNLDCLQNRGGSLGHRRADLDVCWHPLGNRDFCSPQMPCGVGEGDCDDNGDCQAGLRCRTDKGPLFGLGATVDVCM